MGLLLFFCFLFVWFLFFFWKVERLARELLIRFSTNQMPALGHVSSSYWSKWNHFTTTFSLFMSSSLTYLCLMASNTFWAVCTILIFIFILVAFLNPSFSLSFYIYIYISFTHIHTHALTIHRRTHTYRHIHTHTRKLFPFRVTNEISLAVSNCYWVCPRSRKLGKQKQILGVVKIKTKNRN